MNIKYFSFEVSLEQAIDTPCDDIEKNVDPAKCWLTVRKTMEELGYRTALTLTDNDEPSLYYQTTIKGITCRSAKGNYNECASSS